MQTQTQAPPHRHDELAPPGYLANAHHLPAKRRRYHPANVLFFNFPLRALPFDTSFRAALGHFTLS